jgi:hypothetical protein
VLHVSVLHRLLCHLSKKFYVTLKGLGIPKPFAAREKRCRPNHQSRVGQPTVFSPAALAAAAVDHTGQRGGAHPILRRRCKMRARQGRHCSHGQCRVCRVFCCL